MRWLLLAAVRAAGIPSAPTLQPAPVTHLCPDPILLPPCSANTATAGLIIVMIGNLLITLLSSQHGNDAAAPVAEMGGKDMA